MPFCSQCGSQVAGADLFCPRCGSRQPVVTPPVDALAGLSPKTASLLCYIPWMGWVASIVVLSADKFRKDQTVRFHAFQGLYLFVAYLMDAVVLRPFDRFLMPVPHISRVVEGLLLVASIYMMVKVSQGENRSLPLLGDLAHRSAAEQ